MECKYRIGIDGGGTHCRGRLHDNEGKTLAEYVGGPANVFSDFTAAISEIDLVIKQLYLQGQITKLDQQRTNIVAGLAGANVPSVRRQLQTWQPECARHQIFTDVEIACIGAHQAKPGAVLIMGTGSQGAAWDGQHFTRLGGWGFMLSDLASGAVLGQKALRLALLAHEGVVPHTQCTQALMLEYQNSPENMLIWSIQAKPKDWAKCVKRLFHWAENEDHHAVALIQQTAVEAELMIKALLASAYGPIALMGGLASPLTPWLPEDIQSQLSSPLGDALDGAMLLSRREN